MAGGRQSRAGLAPGCLAAGVAVGPGFVAGLAVGTAVGPGCHDVYAAAASGADIAAPAATLPGAEGHRDGGRAGGDGVALDVREGLPASRLPGGDADRRDIFDVDGWGMGRAGDYGEGGRGGGGEGQDR
jgi:hypothetical protein